MPSSGLNRSEGQEMESDSGMRTGGVHEVGITDGIVRPNPVSTFGTCLHEPRRGGGLRLVMLPGMSILCCLR